MSSSNTTLSENTSDAVNNDIMNSNLMVASRDFLPVDLIAKMFEGLHSYTGMPWWLSLLLGSALVRTAILLPLAVVGERAVVTFGQLKPGFDSRMRTLRSECETALVKGRFKNKAEMDEHYTLNYKIEKQNFYERNRCHPALHYAAPITSVPIFVALTCATRAVMYNRTELVSGEISTVANESFHSGGLWFFSDMLLPDPTFTLPVVRLLLMLIQAELNVLRNPVNSRTSILINWVLLRGGAVFMFYISLATPAGIVYCWSIAGMLAIVQTLFLMNPAVRSKCKIPNVANSPRGWDQMMQRAKQRYLRHPVT